MYREAVPKKLWILFRRYLPTLLFIIFWPKSCEFFVCSLDNKTIHIWRKHFIEVINRTLWMWTHWWKYNYIMSAYTDVSGWLFFTPLKPIFSIVIIIGIDALFLVFAGYRFRVMFCFIFTHFLFTIRKMITVYTVFFVHIIITYITVRLIKPFCAYFLEIVVYCAYSGTKTSHIIISLMVTLRLLDSAM